MRACGHTVIIRCSDPRVDVYFTNPEIRERMGLAPEAAPGSESYISNVGGAMRFALPGGPDLVADVALLVEKFGTGRSLVLLTAHSECGGYAYNSSASSSELQCRQTQDLNHLVEHLLAEDLDIEVSAFFISLSDETVEPVVPQSC